MDDCLRMPVWSFELWVLMCWFFCSLKRVSANNVAVVQSCWLCMPTTELQQSARNL